MSDPRTRVRIFVAAVTVLVAVLAGAWYGSRPVTPPPVTIDAAAEEAPHTGTITVHVSGAVVTPGLVTLAAGARVADAIATAGGAIADADLGAINLAAPLHDADRIEVPRRGSAAPMDGAAAADGGGIDLNTATAQQLESLPGVGPVLAERIVAYREAHGPFAAVEDLLDVPGIGEAKLAALRDAVSGP